MPQVAGLRTGAARRCGRGRAGAARPRGSSRRRCSPPLPGAGRRRSGARWWSAPGDRRPDSPAPVPRDLEPPGPVRVGRADRPTSAPARRSVVEAGRSAPVSRPGPLPPDRRVARRRRRHRHSVVGSPPGHAAAYRTRLVGAVRSPSPARRLRRRRAARAPARRPRGAASSRSSSSPGASNGLRRRRCGSASRAAGADVGAGDVGPAVPGGVRDRRTRGDDVGAHPVDLEGGADLGDLGAAPRR